VEARDERRPVGHGDGLPRVAFGARSAQPARLPPERMQYTQLVRSVSPSPQREPHPTWGDTAGRPMRSAAGDSDP
jgi:hypothetical protein